MKIFLCACICILYAQQSYAQPSTAKLTITHLTGNFYIYTTYNTYQDTKLPANGMYLLTNNGAVLFDTPWDTTQFQPLLDSILYKHNKKVNICIATHWHSDRTEGLTYYKQQGIKTYTTVFTDSLCKKNNKKRAEYLMLNDTTFNIDDNSFETFYPGQGHTADNIIIWFSKEKILYGGCLIKGAAANDLGYLGDANLTEYANTLKRVDKKCVQPSYIIISHSNWNSLRSLKHSIWLAKKLKKKSTIN